MDKLKNKLDKMKKQMRIIYFTIMILVCTLGYALPIYAFTVDGTVGGVVAFIIAQLGIILILIPVTYLYRCSIASIKNSKLGRFLIRLDNWRAALLSKNKSIVGGGFVNDFCKNCCIIYNEVFDNGLVHISYKRDYDIALRCLYCLALICEGNISNMIAQIQQANYLVKTIQNQKTRDLVQDTINGVNKIGFDSVDYIHETVSLCFETLIHRSRHDMDIIAIAMLQKATGIKDEDHIKY